MSILGTFRARRSLAKTNLEHGLRHVNDLYWGALAATQFASDRRHIGQVATFVASDPTFCRQGRLQRENLPALMRNTQDELPRTGIIILFSYFEPYLRDLSLSAILSNPRVLVASLAEVDGEHVAKNAAYLALIELLGSRTVDDWLKGTYVERFASLRKVLGLPITTTHPFVRTIDEYYAKRNCMLHRDGFIDERAKRHFNTDVRNQIGARVVANWGDYLSLHRAVHDVADRIDKYVMENHIGNAEVLRVIYRLNREHPEWLAKDVTRELFDMGLGLISRNTLAQLLKVREG